MSIFERLRKNGSGTAAIDYPPHEEGLGPVPSAIDMEEALCLDDFSEHAEETVASLIDPFYAAWSERRQRANIFGGTLMHELWQMRGEAVELAKAYEEKPNKTNLGKLRKQLNAINGYGTALEQDIEKHAKDAQNGESAAPGLQPVNEADRGPIPPLAEEEAGQADTHRERTEKLKSAVAGFTDRTESGPLDPIRQALSLQKVILDKAQREYLDEYKQFRINKGTFSRKPEGLREKEAAYYAALAKYDEEVGKSARERLSIKAEKHAASDKLADIHVDKEGNDRKERILERYDRVVRFKEVIKPASEAKSNTAFEALSLRKRGVVGRLFGALKQGNDNLDAKLGGKGKSRFYKALAVTGVLGIGGAAVGTIAVPGLAAWAGWRLVRVLGGGTLGVAGAELGARAYGRTIGSLIKFTNERYLNAAGKTRKDNQDLDANALKRLIEERVLALKHADQRSIETQKAVIRALGSVFLGAEASAHFEDIVGAVGIHAPGSLESGTGTGATESNQVSANEPVRPQVNQPAPIERAAAPAANGPSADSVRASVDSFNARAEIGQGDGAERLFRHLQTEVRENFHGDIGTAPPAIQAILDKNPHLLAQSLGFQDGELSRRMMLGDSFRIEHDQLVFHDTTTNQDITLIDRQGQIPAGNLEKIHTHMLHTGEAHQPAAHSTHESHARARVEPRSSPTHIERTPPVEAPQRVTPASPEPPPSAVPALELRPEEPAAATPPPEATDVSSENSSEAAQDVQSEVRPEPPVETASANPEVADQATAQTNQPPVPSETRSVSEQSASAPRPQETVAANPDVITNRYGVSVNPREVHLYAVNDARSPGRETLLAYGTQTNSGTTFARIQELARANPGRTIYFESPEPTVINGSPQRWITSGSWTPDGGFVAAITPDPTRPELIGRRMDPNAFRRMVR